MRTIKYCWFTIVGVSYEQSVKCEPANSQRSIKPAKEGLLKKMLEENTNIGQIILVELGQI